MQESPGGVLCGCVDMLPVSNTAIGKHSWVCANCCAFQTGTEWQVTSCLISYIWDLLHAFFLFQTVPKFGQGIMLSGTGEMFPLGQCLTLAKHTLGFLPLSPKGRDKIGRRKRVLIVNIPTAGSIKEWFSLQCFTGEIWARRKGLAKRSRKTILLR